MTNQTTALNKAQITIVGLGLMGGSLGLALKAKQICREVVGLVRRSEAVDQALELGIVDWATLDPGAALSQADIIVFSTPIRVILRQLGQFSQFYKPGAILTDMGSTKQEILQVMASLGPNIQPIGSHPMCGKEVGGMAVAEAGLFKDAPWVLTPLERTTPETVRTITDLAQAIGARPLTLAAARHDRLVATISHLPYTLAASLVLAAQTIAQDDPAVWDVAASGFRDTSRVAASEVPMMLDILLTNRAAVGQLLDVAREQLGRFAAAIAGGDEDSLRAMMEQAAKQRRKMYQ